jgi:hypothetical protein
METTEHMSVSGQGEWRDGTLHMESGRWQPAVAGPRDVDRPCRVICHGGEEVRGTYADGYPNWSKVRTDNGKITSVFWSNVARCLVWYGSDVPEYPAV